jgi:serine/threonine protein kinase
MHVLMCLMDIASAMAYLHSVGVLHGDLKSANVLLKSTATDLRGYVCKLADFGCVAIFFPSPRDRIIIFGCPAACLYVYVL